MPFNPVGTFDAKVVDSKMAKEMSFAAQWGSACGFPFDGIKFLAAHSQYFWMKGLLKDRPTEAWTLFTEGKR